MADNKDIVERLHFIARTDTDLLGYVAQKAADELQQLRAEVERQRATILLLGLADIERLAADNERLRAERDAERAEVERLRDAGDAMAEALDALCHSYCGNDDDADLVDAWEEARRG